MQERDDKRDDFDPPKNMSDLLARLGYNVNSWSSMQELGDTLRWAREERQKQVDRPKRWIALGASTILAIITVSLTMFGQWLKEKFVIGFDK